MKRGFAWELSLLPHHLAVLPRSIKHLHSRAQVTRAWALPDLPCTVRPAWKRGSLGACLGGRLLANAVRVRITHYSLLRSIEKNRVMAYNRTL